MPILFTQKCNIINKCEENDFPPGLPMARGTPTFVSFINGEGLKWNEFKPNDFVTKLLSLSQLDQSQDVKMKVNHEKT